MQDSSTEDARLTPRRTRVWVVLGGLLACLCVLSAPAAAQQELDALATRLTQALGSEESISEASLLRASFDALDASWIPTEDRRFEADPLQVLLDAQALATYAEREHEDWALIDCEVARLLRSSEASDRAYELLQRAEEFYPADNPYRHWVLIELAIEERLRKEWRTALEHLLEARARLDEQSAGGQTPEAQDQDHLFASVSVLGELGANYLELGLLDLAHEPIEEGLQLSVDTGDPALWATALLHRFNLALAMEDHEGLEDAYYEASTHEMFESLWPAAQAQLLLRLGMGRAERARSEHDFFDMAIATFEEVLGGGELTPDESLRARRALAWTLHDAGDDQGARAALQSLFEHLASVESSGSTSLDTDLVVLEARLARDDTERAAALEKLASAFDGFLDQWMNTPVREGGVAFLLYAERHRVASELVSLQMEVDAGPRGVEAALESVLRAQALGSLARTMKAEVPTLESLRNELLEANEGLLVFLPGRDQSHWFLIDGSTVEHVPLPPTSKLDKHRRRLAIELKRTLRGAQSSQSERLRDAVETLSEALLPQALTERLRQLDSLVLVGLDSFGFVPFECLQFDGQALGLRMPVRYLPSVPVGMQLARRARERRRAELDGSQLVVRDIALLTATDPGPTTDWGKLERITMAAEQSEVILRHYDSAQRDWRAGPRAALDRFAELDGEAVRILQLITHGVSDPLRERPAGLLLQESSTAERVLWAETIEKLSMPEWVIVTACGAARAPLRRGDDGRTGLAGSFLLSGAQAVVISHTDLDFDLGLQMMGVLHRELVAGARPSRALWTARKETFAQEESLASLQPFLVHLVGLDQALPLVSGDPSGKPAESSEGHPSDSTRPLTWLWALAGFMLLGGVLLRRRQMRA